ncbi:hypothetical protein AAHA92_17919 [Salvia divinorum]|uniref:Uncharacterized protein n=1 Tax=Salvia divinorum TaxID=28513 RepID=A0ABD1H0F2_SALDI
MKKPMDVENLHSVDVIAPLVQEYLETELMEKQLAGLELNKLIEAEITGWCEAVKTKVLTDQEITSAIMDFCQPNAARSSRISKLTRMNEVAEKEDPTTKSMEKNPLPSEKNPAEKELKTLPPGLKYAYLGENETLLVIINSKLTKGQEERLMEVLGRNKGAIGWTLSDLVGISPDLCMHHIRLEEGVKPHRDPQRKLNPNMREEVMKEILKLLSLGIIYSVPDSEWVSAVHMVPKKSGVQVVTNDKNELVPTRLVTGWRMCIDYRKLNTATRKDHFPYHSLIRCLSDWQENNTFAFWTATVAISKFMSIRRTKPRQLSHFHSGPMHTEECHLACAMPPAPFRDA